MSVWNVIIRSESNRISLRLHFICVNKYPTPVNCPQDSSKVSSLLSSGFTFVLPSLLLLCPWSREGKVRLQMTRLPSSIIHVSKSRERESVSYSSPNTKPQGRQCMVLTHIAGALVRKKSRSVCVGEGVGEKCISYQLYLTKWIYFFKSQCSILMWPFCKIIDCKMEGAQEVSYQKSLLSSPEQGWATAGALRIFSWWALLKERVRVCPSLGTLR